MLKCTSFSNCKFFIIAVVRVAACIMQNETSNLKVVFYHKVLLQDLILPGRKELIVASHGYICPFSLFVYFQVPHF